MRKWRPPDAPASEEWQAVHQIGLHKCCRKEIMSLAHESPMAGHLGINKTYNRVFSHFFWPKMRHDVAKYCRTCHTCQMVGKPNNPIPAAPLKPIPVCGEPFSEVIIDCVGLLPKTRAGNEYLLTIMCKATHFLEAVPLCSIKAPKIFDSLIKFFTFVGLPLRSKLKFHVSHNAKTMYQLGIKQYKLSAYHPQPQGALERFHQTLKNMIKAYCMEHNHDWDQGIYFLLFAAREAIQESLGFSPFELVFSHTIRGPPKFLNELWLAEDTSDNLQNQVAEIWRLVRANELVKKNLSKSQQRMKTWYGKKSKKRCFKIGDRVFALLPIPQQPLQARYFGPYLITRKINDIDYVIDMPNTRKSQRLCHINMLKEYHDRTNSLSDVVAQPVPVAGCVVRTSRDKKVEENTLHTTIVLKYSDVLCNLKDNLHHLLASEKDTIIKLILEFTELFADVPGRAECVHHDVDVGKATPIKQHPYQVNPNKLKLEVDYMLRHEIIDLNGVLVPKKDKTYRFCTDFR